MKFFTPHRAIAFLLFIGSVPAVPTSAELLHLHQTKGLLELRAESDTVKEEQKQTRTTRQEDFFQERLFGSVEGDVYDPKFLDFDLGAGVTFSQVHLSGPGPRFAPPTDTEYRGQVQLFKDHALSESFFFEQAQDTIYNSFVGRSRTERRQFAGNAFLKKGPLPMNMGVRQSKLWGDGFGEPFEQRTEGFSWNASHSRGKIFKAYFNHDTENFEDTTRTDSQTSTSEAQFEWDIESHHQWTARSRYYRRDNAINLRTWDSEASYLHFRPVFQQGLRARYEKQKNGDQEIEKSEARGHIQHRLYESLTSRLSVNGRRTKEFQGVDQSHQLNIDEDYLKKIGGPFSLNLGYAGHFQQTEREIDVLQFTVVDELHVLVDGLPEFLNQLNVITATVQVFRSDGLRRYELNTDYTLVPRENGFTEIRRVPTGNIPNGSAVLVTYEYSAPGEQKTKETTHIGRAALILGVRGQISVLHSDQNQDIIEENENVSGTTVDERTETRYRVNLHWPYFLTNQIWTKRVSPVAPFRSHQSLLQIGGDITPSFKWIGGWSYNRTFFTDTELVSLGRSGFTEATFRIAPRTLFRLEGRTGITTIGDSKNQFYMAYGVFSWSFRSIEMELNNRFTKRWADDRKTEENFFQFKLLREI